MTKSLAHVLIVEDDSELLEVLKFVLEDGGYQVSVAETSADTFEVIAAEQIDLVVLDVNLNGVSGLDIARQLRAETSTRRLPIALHTGSNEDVIRKEFTDYDLFIAKVDDADELLRLVATVLGEQIKEPSE